MAEYCCSCGKKKENGQHWHTIKSGSLCYECSSEIGINWESVGKSAHASQTLCACPLSSIKEKWEELYSSYCRVEQFMPTVQFTSQLKFDDNARVFIYCPIINGTSWDFVEVSYDDIIGANILKETTAVMRQNLLPTLAGGAILGIGGAIVGNMLTPTKIEDETLAISITRKNGVEGHIKFPEMTHISTIEAALNKLNDIVQASVNCQQSLKEEGNEVLSLSAQLRELKMLYEEGLIYPEEYEVKRKQILNL